jgi:hypothetical protein
MLPSLEHTLKADLLAQRGGGRAAASVVAARRRRWNRDVEGHERRQPVLQHPLCDRVFEVEQLAAEHVNRVAARPQRLNHSGAVALQRKSALHFDEAHKQQRDAERLSHLSRRSLAAAAGGGQQ